MPEQYQDPFERSLEVINGQVAILEELIQYSLDEKVVTVSRIEAMIHDLRWLASQKVQ